MYISFESLAFEASKFLMLVNNIKLFSISHGQTKPFAFLIESWFVIGQLKIKHLNIFCQCNVIEL